MHIFQLISWKTSNIQGKYGASLNFTFRIRMITIQFTLKIRVKLKSKVIPKFNKQTTETEIVSLYDIVTNNSVNIRNKIKSCFTDTRST